MLTHQLLVTFRCEYTMLCIYQEVEGQCCGCLFKTHLYTSARIKLSSSALQAKRPSLLSDLTSLLFLFNVGGKGVCSHMRAQMFVCVWVHGHV